MSLRHSWLLAAALFLLHLPMARASSDPILDHLLQPDQVTPWFNGAITSIGQVMSCGSNPPIFATRVMGYAGFSHPPPNLTPAVGEIFYTHVVLGHPGNPCAGSAVGLELILPAGVEIANSADNPVFCFSIIPNPNRLLNLDVDPDYGCPTSFPLGLEGYAVRPLRGGLGNSGAWGMHMGFWLEILIPLRATTPQGGNSTIAWRVNPDVGLVGYPQVGLQVNNEVIFRDGMEGTLLNLDLCTLNPPPQGC
ncbi:MAG: hypothetical protein K8F35_13220 [Dokdonella sp.]|uniref:hypothetical protein n=1 Tax=Dokdonella sp. TaxID=2291710 RepID=UPI0025B9694B|nr:hypothetical protein [Dokdonella sp.]MBZ0223979.1 hypothetical protein [Dokdonella sp.]